MVVHLISYKRMLWVLWLLPLVYSYSILNQCPEMCLCDYETTSCQNSGLTELPSYIDMNVSSLDLSYNEFEAFPTGMSNFVQLKYLNMSHNKIATMKFVDLQGLGQVEMIDFAFNLFHDWKDIQSSAFLPMKKLRFLDLSNNPLRSIPRYSNHLHIQSLEVLRLTNCSMKVIPVDVFNRLSNLKELYLSDNPISSINDSFKLKNLKLMDLSSTRLSYLDENAFFSTTSLETLILNENIHLRRLACHSSSVLYIDLSNSMLEQVPSGYMNRLFRLDLSGNFLKKIVGRSFANSSSLQFLNLSSNAISFLHEQAFEELNQIISIDLSYNKIYQIGERLFSSNPSLIYLNLSHNYIKSLDNISSNSLEMLTASFCEIKYINTYSLILMPNLVTLILARNLITRLPDRMIATKLGKLDVSFCRLNTLNNQTFAEMIQLRELNLASNALTTIDPSFFPRTLQTVITDNPWRCSCDQLKHMFEWMLTYSANDLDDLICNSPEKVEGKTWEQACESEWYPHQITRDTMWYYSLGIVISMVLALFALLVLKKIRSLQDQRVRIEEETRRTEEREALRRMQERQREMQDDEDRNAPDPRELQGPPSYNEALLLPRLDASHLSLAGSAHSFGSRGSLRGSNGDITKKNRIRRKRRRRKSEEERRASRITVDSDSSDQYQSMDSLPSSRRKPGHAPPLESDF
ncbi:leucine-rich repeat-containing G-protein coupled receptor 5 [Dendroctonus ponderosae]|uniref:LRRCT domain-containing protein n=2 Tax=Dendroctonus ponderosae TaxID=77166 RepID=A0AAR5PHR8_DENPD|nr:leucine-rich repeat-containing G-protein coupled receptor 5 [Dendroctonus ponderosae]KAH1029672.1 hypothetical protein HUJ05_002863 [Dendroctonus ponderosae]